MTRHTRTRQFHDTFCLVRKTPFGMGIVEEWLHFAQDERILTDRSNRCGEPNYPGFKDHRHTQSIWSLLCKKHELTEAASTGTATRMQQRIWACSHNCPVGSCDLHLSQHQHKVQGPYG